MDIQKKAMIQALEQTLGIVTQACQQVGIARQTHYNWMNNDENYRKGVESIQDIAIDFAESKLLSRIKEGSDTAIIFYLKTQGKGRGYIERQENHNTHDFSPDLMQRLDKFKDFF